MARQSLVRRARGALASIRNRARSSYGGRLAHGGVVNQMTGMGTHADHTESSMFTPTRFYWRSPLEVLYVQSWAAKKFCRIPVDDMFRRPRLWMDGDAEGSGEAMAEAEARHKVIDRVREAMVAARAYGTGLIVLMTMETGGNMEEPLVPERIRPGDLKAIRVFDRYDASSYIRDYDMFSPTFGDATVYTVHPTWAAAPMQVHSSRILRFDGITALSDSKFYNYEEDWGISELVPVITSLLQDATLASSISHMSQEASIPVLGVSDLRDLIAGQGRRPRGDGRADRRVDQPDQERLPAADAGQGPGGVLDAWRSSSAGWRT